MEPLQTKSRKIGHTKIKNTVFSTAIDNAIDWWDFEELHKDHKKDLNPLQYVLEYVLE